MLYCIVFDSVWLLTSMEGEGYRPTDSDQSAGVDGVTINELKQFKEDHKYE